MKNKKGLLAEASAKTGSGLIFAVVLLFVILGMVITLASVTMLETKMNQKNKSSVGAFYSSESGVEWALNQIATKSGDAPISTIPSCPFTGCSVLFLGQDGKVLATSATIDQVKAVRSVGTQGGETQRAIEAAVASSCSDDPIDVVPDTVTENKTGKKLIVVAYTGASVASNDLIGETAPPGISVFGRVVASDSSSTADVARSSITFVVPPGWSYRVRLGTSGSHSITIQAWEMCS